MMKVAVVGCGIAGASASFLLAERGHDVTLFEQAEKCGPVGAGILLQPAGQHALEQMGLAAPIVESSARIDSLHARHRTGRTLVHLRYAKLQPNCFGLGVHRGRLFSLLFERCRSAGVAVREGTGVVAYENVANQRARLLGCDDYQLGDFDLVVAADGSRSRLRTHSGLVKRIVEYPYAAVWMVGPWSGPDDCLQQVIDPSGRLIGILPIGGGQASFFWGLWQHEREAVMSGTVEAWRTQAVEFHQPCGELLQHLTSMSEVTFATYRNVAMRACVDGRVVFIGDAAHAMSPHLGQGTNLAIVDSLSLSQALASTTDIDCGLATFQKQRRAVVSYYSRLTAILTPFFQTDSRVLQLGRDLALPIMPSLPFVGREMLRTLAGLKRGWLR